MNSLIIICTIRTWYTRLSLYTIISKFLTVYTLIVCIQEWCSCWTQNIILSWLRQISYRLILSSRICKIRIQLITNVFLFIKYCSCWAFDTSLLGNIIQGCVRRALEAFFTCRIIKWCSNRAIYSKCCILRDSAYCFWSIWVWIVVR